LKEKEEKVLRKLISKINPLRTGDQVLFLEDVPFYNGQGAKVIVKKGTLAKIKRVDEKFLTLKLKGETTLYLINTKLAKKVLIKWG